MNDVSQKVALVFGGSRGIGAATVARFAKDGYAVAFTFVSAEAKAHELVRELESAGGRALAIKAARTSRERDVRSADPLDVR